MNDGGVRRVSPSTSRPVLGRGVPGVCVTKRAEPSPGLSSVQGAAPEGKGLGGLLAPPHTHTKHPVCAAA